ncbi:MAG: TIGR01212 family radical SAM protein [Planctomycetaceae bacterium]|jgi:radical SAM protein (TIGR01212 family)|nr:TIGR01212 family radical SAM protein [Planctomycetaceae bacterium]
MCQWQALGYRYFPLGLAMRQTFGCNVWKVSVDAGFSCPNIDGTRGTGGCIFCSAASFAPSRRFEEKRSITEQLNEGIKRVKRHYQHRAEKFIAYFQPSTNTYGEPEYLHALYREALSHPDVAGIAVGTRPDALPESVLDVLERIAATYYLQLEIGLQSIHQKSLDFLERRHSYQDFLDAYERTKRRGIRTGIHLILGIAGEDHNDILATAGEVARLKPDCIKMHNLYVVRETRLAELWSAGTITLPTLPEYAALAVDFLERIPPDIVIERIAGETDSAYLLAPSWTAVKHRARNAVDQEFRRRSTQQGIFAGL